MITVDVTPFTSVDVEHCKVSLQYKGEERHEDVVTVCPRLDHLLEVNLRSRIKEFSINSTVEVTSLHLCHNVGSGKVRLIEKTIINLVEDS